MLAKTIVVFVLTGFVLCDYFPYHSGWENGDGFTDEWLVRIEGGPQVAELIALQMGYDFGGEIVEFPDTYVFINQNHSIQRRNGQTSNTKSISEDPRVRWAEQLFTKKRQKRDFIYSESNIRYKIQNSTIPENHRVKRNDLKIPERGNMIFNDELWSQEWYLQDTRTRSDLPKLDLNVLPVYKMGITGKGVRVSILDDGIEYSHDDLKDNYDPEISWDCNEKDNDPAPRYNVQPRNAHGTRCAGEVAMIANNGKCGVGVAYNAKIGGIKLLDGIVNDKVEGTALGYGYDKIDIYSASWGPNDDGQTVEGPGRLAQEALERGIKKGRNGKGAIFVWASGNGGSRGDNCNCDGYIGSVYTVAIGSASQQGAFPWYGEPCAATLAVTYSSGAYEDQMITTTDLNNECTIKHTGTSASAPLAAGIIALALEANPNLTWRDVQHLIVWTSEYTPLADNLGWLTNGAGFRFDVRFGFGLMNAEALVMEAFNWTTVPEKSICTMASNEKGNASISYGQLYTANFLMDGCSGTVNEINYLEHVEVKVNVAYTIRGVLEIYLTSPAGTRIPLLYHRKFDMSTKGFYNWRFMSVATWGESPLGTWTLEIMDLVGPPSNKGRIGPLTLILHGTKGRPRRMDVGSRKYDGDGVENNRLYHGEWMVNRVEIDDVETVEKPDNDVENPMENSVKAAGDDLTDDEDYWYVDEDKVLDRVHHRNFAVYDPVDVDDLDQVLKMLLDKDR